MAQAGGQVPAKKPIYAPKLQINIKDNITRADFPDGFVFGTGTAAYQVEGAAAEGGRGLSIWDVYALRTPVNIADGSNGNVAVDMYHRYKEDIKMMKKMGFDAYRFSISWPRILPGGKISLGVNREGIDYYNDLINTLLGHGIVPYVTLFHWDLPYTLEQEYHGFFSDKIVDDFREFAELCFWEFGDRVKHWFTLNEPWAYCTRGYVERNFPPGKPVDPKMSSHENTVPASSVIPNAGPQTLISNLFSAPIDNSFALPSSDPPRAANKIGTSFIPYRGNFKYITHDHRAIDHLLDPFRTITFLASKLDPKTEFLGSEIPTDAGVDEMSDQDKQVFIVAKNMLIAHAAAVESYRTKFKEHQKGEIGIVLVTNWFVPKDDNKHEDQEAARRALDFMFGWFLEPVLKGEYPNSMKNINVPPEAQFSETKKVKPFDKTEINLLKGSIDFLGINYYTSKFVEDGIHPDKNDHKPEGAYNTLQNLTASAEKQGNIIIGEECGASWLHIVPWGIYELLNHINDKYNNDDYKLPAIYITENGMADWNDPSHTPSEACADDLRVEYHKKHLAYIKEAMEKEGERQQKLQLKGYFIWSWCDNFEWASGYNHRFGINYIDYKNGLTRHPKRSALWFSNFLVKKDDKEKTPAAANKPSA